MEEWKSYTFHKTQSGTTEGKIDNTDTSEINQTQQEALIAHGLVFCSSKSWSTIRGIMSESPSVHSCGVYQFPFLYKHHQQIEKKDRLNVIMFATNAILNPLICNSACRPMSFVFTRSPLNCSFSFQRHSDCLYLMKYLLFLIWIGMVLSDGSFIFLVCILYSYIDSKEGVDPLSAGGCQFCEFILMIRQMISRVNIFKQSFLGSQGVSGNERKPNGMRSAVTA